MVAAVVPDRQDGAMHRDPQRAAPFPAPWQWVRATVAVALTLGALYAATQAASVVVLVVVATVLAVGLDPMVSALVRRGLGRTQAILIIVLALVGAIAAFLTLAVPPLVHQIGELAQDVPTYVERLSERDGWLGDLARSNDLATQLRDSLASLPSAISGSFGTIIGVTGRVTAAVFSTVTVLILMIYFLSALPRARSLGVRLVAPEHRDRARRIIDQSITKIGGYVVGVLTTSLIGGTATLVALLVIGVPFSVPLAVWAALSALVPVFGAYLGAIPAIIVAAFSSPAQALAVAAWFLVYQQIENYVIVPRVMKGAVDLSPPAVLLSTLVGGSLAGFAGALLALPVAATLKVVVSDLWLAERLAATDVPPRGDAD